MLPCGRAGTCGSGGMQQGACGACGTQSLLGQAGTCGSCTALWPRAMQCNALQAVKVEQNPQNKDIHPLGQEQRGERAHVQHAGPT